MREMGLAKKGGKLVEARRRGGRERREERERCFKMM